MRTFVFVTEGVAVIAITAIGVWFGHGLMGLPIGALAVGIGHASGWCLVVDSIHRAGFYLERRVPTAGDDSPWRMGRAAIKWMPPPSGGNNA